MKRWKKWLLAALFVLAVCILWLLCQWEGYTRAEQEALSIIGGADGPTSILISKIAP